MPDTQPDYVLNLCRVFARKMEQEGAYTAERAFTLAADEIEGLRVELAAALRLKMDM